MSPSHGSLSKSGRIRHQAGHQKKFRLIQKGMVTIKRYHKKKHKSPIRSNRRKYTNRFINKRKLGNKNV